MFLFEVTYCHGSENYFLLIDGLSQVLDFEEKDYRNFTLDTIAQIPQLKIDGLLYLLPSTKADARMRIFNRDGSEAEMCGNGFRCLGKKLFEITGKRKFKLETLSGILLGAKETEIYPSVDSYSVQFTNLGFQYRNRQYTEELIPELDDTLKFSSIDIGNPHLAAEVSKFDLEKLIKIGEQVNTNCRLFPDGNNISFYKILSPEQLYIITHERGVGLTSSCGTAMAATSLLAAKLQKIASNTWIDVLNPGGMVRCLPQISPTNDVKLLGNATFVKKYQISYDKKTQKIEELRQTADFQKEAKAYRNFKQSVQLYN